MFKKTYTVEARSAIIAFAVAVLVAAPLSNAATDQASIVVKKVTGKRGPRGFTGPQGPQGLQGDRGPAGPSAPWLRDPSRATLAPGITKTIAGYCPNHSTTGGNYYTDGPVPELTILTQSVSADAEYFYLVLRNDTSHDVVATANPICA
jgi:hypothetical protein